MFLILMHLLRQNYLVVRRWWGYQPARALNTLVANKPPSVLVASIGNPETSQFNNTRHNVGHLVVNELVESGQFGPFKSGTLPNGATSTGRDQSNVTLYKCNTTYMNIVGPPVAKAWARYRKNNQAQFSPALVVVCDDTRVPFGRVLVRPQASSPRGHNGLKSLDLELGKMYTRIAVGVGSPANSGDKHIMADYVLGKFGPNELDVLRQMVVPEVAALVAAMAGGAHVYDVWTPPKRRR